MNAELVLFVIAAAAVWIGCLYLAPFGRCPKCMTMQAVGRSEWALLY